MFPGPFDLVSCRSSLGAGPIGQSRPASSPLGGGEQDVGDKSYIPVTTTTVDSHHHQISPLGVGRCTYLPIEIKAQFICDDIVIDHGIDGVNCSGVILFADIAKDMRCS